MAKRRRRGDEGEGAIGTGSRRSEPDGLGGEEGKRHLLADGRGVPMSLVVSGVDVHDCKRLDAVLSAMVIKRKTPPINQSAITLRSSVIAPNSRTDASAACCGSATQRRGPPTSMPAALGNTSSSSRSAHCHCHCLLQDGQRTAVHGSRRIRLDHMHGKHIAERATVADDPRTLLSGGLSPMRIWSSRRCRSPCSASPCFSANAGDRRGLSGSFRAGISPDA